MMPFTTAERKVLGVAAPSQQQTPLNWPYLPPPNPYNLQARLDRFRQSDLCAGGAASRSVQTAIHRSDQYAHSPPPHQARRAVNDFDVRNLSQFVETAESSSRIMALSVGRSCLDLAYSRRHRHHEHPAGIGDRAHARDRPAHGDRRAAAARVAAIPRRSRVSQRQRRPCRHRDGYRVPCHFIDGRVARADFPSGGRRWFFVFRRGRRVLRLLSGAQSRSARSDRGAALRIRQRSRRHLTVTRILHGRKRSRFISCRSTLTRTGCAC